jgi:NO-binding membrane sensor protein with MHYT domain
MLQFILDRAKEPSTYAGLAALLTAAGIHYSTDVFNAGVAVAVAAAGLVAVLLPERKAS